jgi:hypothetical protein
MSAEWGAVLIGGFGVFKVAELCNIVDPRGRIPLEMKRWQLFLLTVDISMIY